ncbi:hypothetical protein N7495_005657 [Penicillium taxi]|uniref:uncharacterized protein n=1 Tax=Penicillium taxi TaxID=168475 RepID=UPI00254559F9|nr:uncharacterized protein N7495_005657 [Penicillium taxi]KAJ5893966.1 hypothetical protein N7495_005657 [Penicillium taxi]
MLFSMLGYWILVGEPRYGRMKPGQTIPFISDIGGTQELKPVFMAGSMITMLFMNISFYQFVQKKGESNKIYNYLSFTTAIAGSIGLIMLSIFDNLDHLYAHDSFVALFMTGYLISATVICIEYFYLDISYRLPHRMLTASFAIKLSFVIIELAFILAFRVTAQVDLPQKNTAAVLEWIIAFLFGGYILSFVMDLLPLSEKDIQYQQLEMDMDSHATRIAI